MSKFTALCRRAAGSLEVLDRDEDGLNTIEMVLIICVAAFLLVTMYKFLWEGDQGKIKIVINKVIQNFENVFGQANGAKS